MPAHCADCSSEKTKTPEVIQNLYLKSKEEHDNIAFVKKTNVRHTWTESEAAEKKAKTDMDQQPEYYIVRHRAVPEVLRKVTQVNRLLASGKVKTVNEATASVGISRSSYYKFKDDIEVFHDEAHGKTVTLLCEINDEPGVLANTLRVIAEKRANVLTIHQSIPLSGVASLSISIQILEDTDNVDRIIESLEAIEGMRQVRITGRA